MIKFTKSESEILLHRLGVPDAIAGALEEEFLPEEVKFVTRELARQIRKGEPWDHRIASLMEKAIIKDCCDGSTFFAGTEDAIATGEVTLSEVLRALNYRKAARRLEIKLKTIGIDVCIPNY